MFADSAGADLAGADDPLVAGGLGGGGGGGGGGPYAGRGSFGPRQMGIRCHYSRRTSSLGPFSFINSTRRRIRSISKTLSELSSGSLIAGFRGLDADLDGGRLPPGRGGRGFSGAAMEQGSGVESQGPEVG